jgi:hypothetical protein
MGRRREEILTPVAREFNDAIAAARSSADDSERLKPEGDALSEITRQFRVLDDACPAWPLQLRRLRSVIATAVLPVAISVVTAVILGLLTP